MKKRIIYLLVALVLFMGLLPFMLPGAKIVADGACGARGDNVTWKLDDTGTLTVSGTGAMIESVCPWHSQRESVKKAVIEDGVTAIGSNNFEGCSSLTSISIPDSVVTIGSRALAECGSLTDITVGSIAYIGSGAFSGCRSLTSAAIPDSVTAILDDTFSGCTSLASVTIPDSVAKISVNAFEGCNSLKEVNYSGTRKQWGTISVDSGNGCLLDAAIHYIEDHLPAADSAAALDNSEPDRTDCDVGPADLTPAAWDPPLTKGEYIAETDGKTETGASYVRTTALWCGKGHVAAVRLDSDEYLLRIAYYDENGTLEHVENNGYIGSTGYFTGLAHIPANAVYFGLTFRRTDQGALADDDIDAIADALSAYSFSDAPLIMNGDAAAEELMNEATENARSEEQEPGPAIKAYYREEMRDTVKSVRDCQTEPCLVMPLVTDIHYGSASTGGDAFLFTRETLANLSRFSREVQCDGLICLGDIHDGGYGSSVIPSSSENAEDVSAMLLNSMRGIGLPLYYSMGNHDDCRYFDPYMTAAQIYSTYMSQSDKDVVFDTGYYGLNYYKDFPQFGVRLIEIDTNKAPGASKKGAYGVSAQTVSFLTDALASMDDDDLAVIITHAPIISGLLTPKASSITGASSAVRAINESGKTVIVLSGHTHYDISTVDPFIHVVTAANKNSLRDEDNTGIATKGTGTGQVYVRQLESGTKDLWDVVVLRPFSRIIDFIRFGSGVNRRFHITPTAPTTVETELTGTITWSTSDPGVATVSDGAITGVGSGRCAVTATDDTGNMETWVVEY